MLQLQLDEKIFDDDKAKEELLKEFGHQVRWRKIFDSEPLAGGGVITPRQN